MQTIPIFYIFNWIWIKMLNKVILLDMTLFLCQHTKNRCNFTHKFKLVKKEKESMICWLIRQTILIDHISFLNTNSIRLHTFSSKTRSMDKNGEFPQLPLDWKMVVWAYQGIMAEEVSFIHEQTLFFDDILDCIPASLYLQPTEEDNKRWMKAFKVYGDIKWVNT